MDGTSVAIIGSFRKHYATVLEAIRVFSAAGWRVTSPAGADVLDPNVQFVRFSTDPPECSDPYVQSVTLRNIFQADVVLVVCPEGYIGRTTCYEVGRLRQAGVPMYFTAVPNDLPILVPEHHVLDATHLVRQTSFERLEDAGTDAVDELERQLRHQD